MALSREVRRLANRWDRGDFPKHLEWLEITNLRGWTGQRIDFKFPIVAIVGENGSGKTTILQAAASIYQAPQGETSLFASTFFPDTPWESTEGVNIKGSVIEGNNTIITSVRKPTTRWRGNDRRRERRVHFMDLRRTQPIYARVGYAKLAKRNLVENNTDNFNENLKNRLSSIVGKQYAAARQSYTNIDDTRQVPVLQFEDVEYSGFHQGAGEATIADLLSLQIHDYSLVLIDEIETSLHPRAQRRLIRDLANIARVQRVQFIITTHSPYVLEELPQFARIQVLTSQGQKEVVVGISPEFALSKMDEEHHPEVDVYVEDKEAKILIEEIIAAHKRELLPRLKIIPYGAASVGKSLGIMAANNRFPRPSIVLLDADQDPSDGCLLLPGGDAPEIEIFEGLSDNNWPGVAGQISRSHAQLVDGASNAMTLPDHHDWIISLADHLIIGGEELWRASCRSWVANLLDANQVTNLIEAIHDVLDQD
jgi:predicted ATPase